MKYGDVAGTANPLAALTSADHPPAEQGSFDRIWRDLSDSPRLRSRVLTTKTGSSEYLLALSLRGVMLRFFEGGDQSFGGEATRRLRESRHVLGASVDIKPADIKDVRQPDPDGHYLWAVYAKMSRDEHRTKRSHT